jgi:hypothetical protein
MANGLLEKETLDSGDIDDIMASGEKSITEEMDARTS